MAASSAREFVDRLLTTHDTTLPYEQREQAVRDLLAELQCDHDKDAVRELLERYLCADYKVSEDYTDRYDRVFQDAYYECDGRYVDLDIGDYGNPLPAFGPQANAWQALIETFWSQDQAVDFALRFIQREETDFDEVTVPRVVIEICSVYPDEASIAEAIVRRSKNIDLQNCSLEEIRYLDDIVSLFGFYFLKCRNVIPFLKDQLDHNRDAYKRENAFRVLCKFLPLEPKEWDYLVSKFKTSVGVRMPSNIPGKTYVSGRLYTARCLEWLLEFGTEAQLLRDLVSDVLGDELFEEQDRLEGLLQSYDYKLSGRAKPQHTGPWSA
ncbi:hypothetical protein [Roseibium sp.]|uniref:hypothetical protein n=1 Tax=Roseibium sp. TaxID=1936156 RepID=UPI003BB044C4